MTGERRAFDHESIRDVGQSAESPARHSVPDGFHNDQC